MLTDEERQARFDMLPGVIDRMEELIIGMAGLIHLAQRDMKENQIPLFQMSQIHTDSGRLFSESTRFQTLIKEITKG
jgi:hypothetical protein